MLFLTMTFLHSVIMILAKTGHRGPILKPSVCQFVCRLTRIHPNYEHVPGRHSTSSERLMCILCLEDIWLILLATSKESLTFYMSCVRRFKSLERYFSNE